VPARLEETLGPWFTEALVSAAAAECRLPEPERRYRSA
jgi:hypothetical protein